MNLLCLDYPYDAAILNKCCDIDEIRMASGTNRDNIASRL